MRRRDVVKSAMGAAAIAAQPVRSFAQAAAQSGAWRLPAKGEVRMIENSFIPMADGVKLAVQLWLPAERRTPAPVVLEYIPYRKRDRYRALWHVLGPDPRPVRGRLRAPGDARLGGLHRAADRRIPAQRTA